MTRYAFTPIPIRLPLSVVAALADAMAMFEISRTSRAIRPTRLALMFRVQQQDLPSTFCALLPRFRAYR